MWSYILYLSLARSPARGLSCLCGLCLFTWFFLSMWFSLGLLACCFSRLSGLMFLSTLCLTWYFSQSSDLALWLVLHSASVILISVGVHVLPLYAPSETFLSVGSLRRVSTTVYTFMDLSTRRTVYFLSGTALHLSFSLVARRVFLWDSEITACLSLGRRLICFSTA
jgi:hypothetical protein